MKSLKANKAMDKMLRLIRNGIVVPISHNLASFTYKQVAEVKKAEVDVSKPVSKAEQALLTLSEKKLYFRCLLC